MGDAEPLTNLKTIPWKGDLASFKMQFPAFIDGLLREDGLQFRLRNGVEDVYHDEEGVAKSVPAPNELNEVDFPPNFIANQNFVRRCLILAFLLPHTHATDPPTGPIK